MKKVLIFAIITFVSIISLRSEGNDIPAINLKTVRGETVNSSTFNNDGKPMVINFWATWCKPCIMELNNINEVYKEWQDETGVKFIAISVDDSRNARKVAPFIKGRGWSYDVYIDENQDFRRAMGVQNPPHTFLYDGKGNLVYEHNGYAPGDEDILYKKIKELVK